MGHRELALLSVDLLADFRVVVDESSTGHRDVAFLSADLCVDVDESPVTGHREVSLSAPSPTSDFGFGFTGLGASAAARSRAAFAAALLGSKRGGSVCFLT
jgi:hypothetical protein